jgi:hypothetical protein
MATSLLIAAAAEASTRTGATAYLVGKIDRPTFVSYAGGVTLRAMSAARLSGAYWAARQMRYRTGVTHSEPSVPLATPTLVTDADQSRIVAAVQTIAEDSAIVQNWTPAAEVSEVSSGGGAPDTEPEIVMRSTRLAHAETIASGRTGYAAAVSDALGDDHEFTWRFEPSAKACARCIALAQLTFSNYEDAGDGAHPSCECVLIAEVED